MIDPTTLYLYIGAALLLLLVPGPAVLYIVARSVDQGRRAGIVSVLGISVGSLIHIALAAAGLSALLLASAFAFGAVKFAGAGYLVYLGMRSLLQRAPPAAVAAPQRDSLGNIFWQGVVVNALNPKTALFFLAFLPQFVSPARGPVALQVLLLGAIFTVLAIASDSVYALVAGRLGEFLRRRRAFRHFQHRFGGVVMIALGVGAALSGGGQK